MTEQEREYLLARARTERALAGAAPTPKVRSAHQRLADEYEARAKADDQPRKSEEDVLGGTTSDDGLSAFRVLDPLPAQPRRSGG